MEPRQELDKLENALVYAGRVLAPARTPDFSARVLTDLRQQAKSTRGTPLGRARVRWAGAALAAALLALVLVLLFPDTREALAQLLGLRTVRIIPITPTLTATAGAGPATATAPSAQCCPTTLEDARARTRFKLLLPPEVPSRVYFQDLKDFGGAQQVILVFGNPDAPRFTLYEATNFLYGKIVSGGTVVEETKVNGQRALWLTGAPHLLVRLDANGRPQAQSERTVNVNTLAWEIGNVTYRLETSFDKEEAVRIAESLR